MTQLVLEHLLHNALALASPGTVDLVVTAHERSHVAVGSILERPGVHLAKNPVRHIGAHRVSLQLLLVGKPVLSSSLNTRLLHAFNGMSHHDTLEVGIRAEAFPITATIGVLAKRTSRGAQLDVDAKCLGLCAEEGATLPDEVNVPGAGSVNTSRESGDTIDIADTERAIFMLSARGHAK